MSKCLEKNMTLQDFFNVNESYRLPDKINEVLLADNAEETIKEIKRSICGDIRDMFQEEQGDRKNLKQDFTPDCVCAIVSGLMVEGTCLDMCSGTGVLSKHAVKKHGINVNEQEFSERTIPFALLDACISGMDGMISRADCLRNIVYESYKLEKRGDISVPRQVEPVSASTYDNVIMNPPYSMKFPEAKEMPIMGHMIPTSKADYGFILRGVEHLKDGGRLIAVLPHGVLFRGAGEGKIREWLIKENLINAVIGLPDKLFLNTSIPVCILVLQRNSENILLVDSSKEFIKNASRNNMTEEQIKKVLDAYNKRCDIERFSHVATYSEVEKNDFNLNIPRYVDTFVEEPLPDASEILRNLKEIDREEKRIKDEIFKMLSDLCGDSEDMKVVEAHKEVLRRKHTQRVKREYEQMELMDLWT